MNTKQLMAMAFLGARSTWQPAEASTLPAVDRQSSAFSIGSGITQGPGAALDLLLDRRVQLGLVAGFSNHPDTYYRLRAAYTLSQPGDRLTTALIGGMTTRTIGRDNSPVFQRQTYFDELNLGLGFAYQVTPQLTARLTWASISNLLLSPITRSNLAASFAAQDNGAELGYRLSSSMEITAGISTGLSQLVGINYSF